MTSDIKIQLPAHPAFLRYARVTAATLGDDAGLDVEGIERLRIAVDEMCALAMGDASEDALLDLTMRITDEQLTVTGRCAPVGESPEVDPIAKQLLDRAVDSHSLTHDGSVCEFSLVKNLKH